jgi:hypothetical protein
MVEVQFDSSVPVYCVSDSAELAMRYVVTGRRVRIVQEPLAKLLGRLGTGGGEGV